MTEGLKIIQLPGRYGYSTTLVGWLKRIAGDEYVLLPGHRSTWRTSGARTLGELGSDGPKNDHGMSPPQKDVEEIHRLLVRRCRPASEKAWGEHVKRPDEAKEPKTKGGAK